MQSWIDLESVTHTAEHTSFKYLAHLAAAQRHGSAIVLGGDGAVTGTLITPIIYHN